MGRIVQSKVEESSRKDKKFMRTVKEVEGGEVTREKTVHFGDPKMTIKKDEPERKKSYCARSSGQKGTDDPFSPNNQSRKMWNC